MADSTRARRYLHLAAESAVEVKRLVSPGSSGPEINRLQCNYLSVKLAEAIKEAVMHIIKEESEECVTKKLELVLKTLCRVAQDVERFVSFCCNERWRHPALLLGDPCEQVTQVASELRLSIQLLQIITSNSSGAAEHQITLTPEICQSMRELSEAEVAVIKENARLDNRNLVKRLDDEYGSSRTDFMPLYLNTSSFTVSSSARTPSKVDADRKLLKLESIGRGAFATVYKTKWMGETYAQKVFTHTEAFKNEASILAGLSHPNIMPIVCVGVTTPGCRCFLLTELMDGDLHALMEERMERVMNLGEFGDQTMPFDLTQAVDLMLQIAEGVRYLHKEANAILHGNLRAANVLIKQVKPLRQFPDNDQEHFQAKVASFGLSRELKNKDVTYNTQTYRADSVRWMAPELVGWLDQNHHVNLQVKSQLDSQDVQKNFPLQADVYSFGMVCYEILTGCIPFSEMSRSDLKGKILEGLKPEIPKTCPPRLTVMIEKCWSVSPSERPSFQGICMELTRFKCELMIENKVDLPAQSSSDCSSSKMGGMKSDLEYDESLLKLEELKKSADTKEEREMLDYLIERYKTKRRSPFEADSADLKTGCRLGKGESGIIYETTLLGCSFARKDFPGTFKSHIFEQEASNLIDLRHENIVRIFCWALDRRSCSLVMELMADDLHTLVQKRKETKRKTKTSTTSANSFNSTVKVEESKNQKVDLKTFLERVEMMQHKQAIIPFDISEAIDIMFLVAKGMKYLDGKGVAHGDLKPKNILVGSYPGGLDHKVVKVCDFGLTKTKTLSSLSNTVQTQHVGTCRWKAPELIEAVKDEESSDLLMDTLLSSNQSGHVPECFIQSKLAKADVYSFALTCTEILTGEVPFSKSEFPNFHDFYKSIIAGVRPELPATCPRELQNLVQRCWDTNPACRPAFNEICDELEKFQQDVKRGTAPTAQDEMEEQQELMHEVPEVPDDISASAGCSFWFKDEVPDTDSGILKWGWCLRPMKPQYYSQGGSAELDGGLLEIALGKLEKEFTRLLADESRPVELPEHLAPQAEDGSSTSSELESFVIYSPEVLQRLQAIVAKLAGTDQYQRCVDAYQETRNVQCNLSLQNMNIGYLQNSTPELVNQISWDDLQHMIQLWTQQLEVVVKVLYAGERHLARQVFKDLGQPVWVECLSKIAQQGITPFMQFGESVSKSSQSPEKLFKLLDMFESMEKCEHSVMQVFDGQACHEIRSRYRELLKQVVNGALKTFWGLKVWVEEQKEPPCSDASVMKLCRYVMNFLKYVVHEYPKAMNKILRIEHSWRGGEGQERTLAQGILLFLQALEGKVESRAKEFQEPAMRHIFMINNLYYIRSLVKKSDLLPLVDDKWISDMGRKVKQNALKYQREGWQRVADPSQPGRTPGAFRE